MERELDFASSYVDSLRYLRLGLTWFHGLFWNYFYVLQERQWEEMPLTLCTAVFLVSLYLIENYILFTDNCFTLGIVYFLHNVTYQFGTSQINCKHLCKTIIDFPQ